MTRSGVIDLDLDEDWRAPERSYRRPVPHRRLGWVAALIAILAGVLGGDVPRTFVPVFGLAGGVRQVIAAPGMIIVLAQDASTYTLRAYRLGGFREAWRVAVSGDYVTVVDDTALVLAHDEAATGIEALDLGTGRRLFQRPGATLLATAGADGSALILSEPPHGADAAVDPVETLGVPTVPPQEIVAVGVRTGQVRWSVRTPPGAQVDVTDPADGTGPARLVEVDPSGRTDVRDLVTGAVRSSTTVNLPAPPWSITARNDLVVVYGDGGTGESAAAAFSILDGQLRWERAGLPDAVISVCGTWLCEADLLDAAVLDPRTGATRWRLDGWEVWYPLGGDRMMALGDRVGEPSRLAVVDVATSRMSHEVLGWWPAGELRGPVQVVARQEGSGGLVGLYDPGSARLTPVGRVSSWPDDGFRADSCQTAGDYLACRAGASMAVWHVWPDSAG